MTIVSLRGTHGSGKSTVVRKILGAFPSCPVNPTAKGKPEGYAVELPSGWLYVRGPYHTACGGCDAVQPYADIWPAIEYRMDNGCFIEYGNSGSPIEFSHCLFEGALVSSGYGNLGRATEKYGDKVVFAFLDTPLEVALDRIAQRRAARWVEKGKPGLPPPVDPKNTTAKFNHVLKSYTAIKELGRRVTIIDHSQPVKEVLALMGVNIRKEPQ